VKVTCIFKENGSDIQKIIHDSFLLFMKKELIKSEKCDMILSMNGRLLEV